MSSDHSDEWRKTEKYETREEKGFKKSAPTETSLCSHSAACVYVALSLRAQNLNVFSALLDTSNALVRGSI